MPRTHSHQTPPPHHPDAPRCTRTNSATGTRTLLRTHQEEQTDTPPTHARTHGRGHTQTRTLTRVPTSRVHTRPLSPTEPRARARARAPRSAREWVTAPRPGLRPFPGPRRPDPVGPRPQATHRLAGGLGCRREDRRTVGGSGGSYTSWRRRSCTLVRWVPPPPARARARAPAPPRRGAAPPPALVRAAATQALGGARAGPSPRPDPLTLPSPLSRGPPPHFKAGETEAQITQRVRSSISPSSRALDI